MWLGALFAAFVVWIGIRGLIGQSKKGEGETDADAKSTVTISVLNVVIILFGLFLLFGALL